MNLTPHTDARGRRTYSTEKGEHFISVTTGIAMLHEVSGEPEPYGGMPEHILRLHQLEGEGCHRVALDWMALKQKWVTTYTPPPFPNGHGDITRWKAVMLNAVTGFADWAEQCEFEAHTIEEPSYCPIWGLAGCPDLSGTMLAPPELRMKKGRRIRAVVDLKFTFAIQDTSIIQVCSYGHLKDYRKTKQNPTGCDIGVIIRIDRATGKWEQKLVPLTSRPHDLAALAAVVQVLRWGAGKKTKLTALTGGRT